MIDYFINNANFSEKEKQKSNCHTAFSCYFLNYGNLPENIDLLIEKMKNPILKDVNIGKIIEYKTVENKENKQRGYFLQEQTQGQVLYKKYRNPDNQLSIKKDYISYVCEHISWVSSTSQENYNKFVNDYYKLRMSGLDLEKISSTSLLFDIRKGFTFVRLKPSENFEFDLAYKNLLTPLICSDFKYIKDCVSINTLFSLKNIAEKLKKAFIINKEYLIKHNDCYENYLNKINNILSEKTL